MERNEYYLCMREVLLQAASPQRLLGNVEQCEGILRQEGYGFSSHNCAYALSSRRSKHITWYAYFDWSFCG